MSIHKKATIIFFFIRNTRGLFGIYIFGCLLALWPLHPATVTCKEFTTDLPITVFFFTIPFIVFQLSEWRSCEAEDNSIDGSGVEPGCAPHTEGVRLRVERWGECRPSPHEVWDGENSDRADNYYKHWPQVGTQRREFTCLNVNGTTVPLRLDSSSVGIKINLRYSSNFVFSEYLSGWWLRILQLLSILARHETDNGFLFSLGTNCTTINPCCFPSK